MEPGKDPETLRHEHIVYTANLLGLIFTLLSTLGILFIVIGAAGELSGGGYFQFPLMMVYPVGLLVGLRRKGLGSLICLSGLLVFILTDLTIFETGLLAGPAFPFFLGFFLLQMLPVTYYLLAWYIQKAGTINTNKP